MPLLKLKLKLKGINTKTKIITKSILKLKLN